MRPTFVIAGACAAGCSQLTAALKQHPDIFLPRNHRPEPHYFYKSWEYQKPLSYYEKKYFSDVKHEKAIGETSGSYLFGSETPERIFKAYSDIKIIISLRNPIDRAYSGYRATAFHGLEDLSFDDALRYERKRIADQEGQWKEIQPFNYTGRGLYGEQLQRFLMYFSEDQIFVVKSEQTRRNPVSTFQRAYQFLNVADDFTPICPPTYTSRSVVDLDLQKSLRSYFRERFDLIIDTIEKETDDPLALGKTHDEREMIKKLQRNLLADLLPMSEWAHGYLSKYYQTDLKILAPLLTFAIDDWV